MSTDGRASQAPAAATSFSSSPRRCSPSAGCGPPRCATSPTRRASCPAACTTTSLQGVDGRRGPARLPGLAVRPLPGDRRDRAESAGAAQGPVHGVVRGDRAPARAGRDLPGRGQAAVAVSRGSPTSTNATESNARCGWTCSTRASRTATSAPTSTSTWSTGSSATPSGFRSAGISPADRSRPNKSADSTSPSSSAASPRDRKES